MNPEQELEEEQQEIDYDAIYGGIDVNTSNYQRPKEIESEYKKILKDVAKQGAKETLIGVGGTYGDLAELVGLKKKESDASYSVNRDKNFKEHEILTKMREPGYQSSLEDLVSLQSNDNDIPGFQLPTTQNLRDVNEAVGGPGQGETLPGKTVGRIGKVYGSGLAFGQANPIPAIVAGVAGQAVEEGGGGQLAQTAAEIVSLLATQGKSLPLSSAKKDIKAKIEDLRKLGYTDEEITLAINSANKGGKTAQVASRGKKTEQAFEDFSEHSDEIIGDILAKEVPGFEQGVKRVHEMASDVYGQVAQEGASFVIKDSTPFIKAATKVVKEVRENLGKNPEAEGFLKRLHDAVIDSTQNPSAKSFMNFYKELNGLGKWMGRSEKDRLLTQMKNGVKDTFRSEGKKGQQFAEKFEKANEGIRKAYLAEDVSDLLSKVKTQEGYDYKKLNKIFDKDENVKLFTDVLGKEQTKNLKLIANTGKDIKDFDKAWKGVNGIKVGSVADVARGGLGAYYIYQQDWEHLALVAASKAGGSVVRKLAEKSLTDPKLQNIIIRGLHAVGHNSPQSLALANASLQRYLDEQGIDIDLDQIESLSDSK